MRTVAGLFVVVSFSLCACGGGDKPDGIDRAKVDAAPQKYKDTCEGVCTSADSIRSQGCGQTEYSTHEDCYLHCVDDYLNRPQCESAFDEAYACLNQYLCQAATMCIGQLIVAAQCRDQ